VSGEDAGRGDASGGGVTGDEAAWRDLVARFSMPADPAEAPWPEREDLQGDPAHAGLGESRGAGPPGDPGAEPAGDRSAEPADDGDAGPDDGRGAEPDDGHDASPADPQRGAGADRTRVIRPATSAASPSPVPASPAVPQPAPGRDDEDSEHYVPPPPPPLPHLDSVAKGAWTALFGGPAYLLFTTLMGWTVPGWAALLAVMAFVGGFATVVLRLGDGPSRGSGPDSGAVL
jgi:hypothetical protein